MNKDADLEPRLATRLFDIHLSQQWEITASTYRLEARDTPKGAQKEKARGTPERTRGRRGLGVSGQR